MNLHFPQDYIVTGKIGEEEGIRWVQEFLHNLVRAVLCSGMTFRHVKQDSKWEGECLLAARRMDGCVV